MMDTEKEEQTPTGEFHFPGGVDKHLKDFQKINDIREGQNEKGLLQLAETDQILAMLLVQKGIYKV